MGQKTEALVVVAPRLLSDVLAEMLREHGIEVYRCPVVDRRAVPREPPREFDLAVVTDALPADADAAILVRVRPDGSTEVVLDEGDEEIDFTRLLDALRPPHLRNSAEHPAVEHRAPEHDNAGA